jgi:hypothetical protein
MTKMILRIDQRHDAFVLTEINTWRGRKATGRIFSRMDHGVTISQAANEQSGGKKFRVRMCNA